MAAPRRAAPSWSSPNDTYAKHRRNHGVLAFEGACGSHAAPGRKATPWDCACASSAPESPPPRKRAQTKYPPLGCASSSSPAYSRRRRAVVRDASTQPVDERARAAYSTRSDSSAASRRARRAHRIACAATGATPPPLHRAVRRDARVSAGAASVHRAARRADRGEARARGDVGGSPSAGAESRVEARHARRAPVRTCAPS